MPVYSESYPWPQLTAQQQVQHMRENGITFNGLSEREACDFLRCSNFFFKVKARASPCTKKFKKGLASPPSFGNIYLALQRVVFHAGWSKQVGVAELADALA